MYVITFYSFKGGVGRTMALVNVAAELVRRGRKVLVVDFDLEAPGLETYERLRPPKPVPGIVEYVTEFRRTQQVPNLLDYLYEAPPLGEKGGRLWVMPSGRCDRAYPGALANLDWQRLYRDRAGFILFEDTKRGWEEELKPDYVLIDSRTGHTDVEGICTRQLPNAVVVLFFPNEQNLAGLRDVCRRIRAERTSGLKKEIRLHFVMSNVPDLDDEDGTLRRRLEAFHKELGFGKPAAIIHRYESVMLFNQAIFVLDRPSSRLAREYQQLTAELITANPADREGALRSLHQYAQRYLPRVAQDVSTEVKRKLGVIEEEPLPAPTGCDVSELFAGKLKLRRTGEGDALDRIIGNFLDDADILLRAAECRTLAGDFKGAIALLTRVLAIKPDLSRAVFERAMCKNRLGDTTGAAADLLQYLRSPSLGGGDILRALRELRTIAPAQMIDAVNAPTVRGLDERIKLVEVCNLLSDTEEGLAHSIQIKRQMLAHAQAGFGADVRESLSYDLLAARQWREAIELLKTEEVDTQYYWFNLAMGYWGETGNLPESLCRLVMDKADEQDDRDMCCLVLWRLGETSKALDMLALETNRARETHKPIFSLWRYRWVSPEKYLDDCEQLRRMIRGEPIRPAFLGEPTSSGEPGQTR